MKQEENEKEWNFFLKKKVKKPYKTTTTTNPKKMT
jgi:hypothetical protein